MSDTKALKIGFYRNRDHSGERVEVVDCGAAVVVYRDVETGERFMQTEEAFRAFYYEERYSGYYEHARDPGFPVQAGQEVVIPRGAVVTSTNPKRKKWVTKRALRVKVDSVSWGVSDTLGRYKTGAYPNGGSRDNPFPVVNPEVTWAGAGGYWCWVDVNEVLEGNKS